MHCDRYRAMQLPIGSGTVESSCKNVIGARMKQGGIWGYLLDSTSVTIVHIDTCPNAMALGALRAYTAL